MKKANGFSWINVCIMIGIAFISFFFLPDEFAVQWSHGNVSGTAGKWLIFAFPALGALVTFLHSSQLNQVNDKGLWSEWLFCLVPLVLLGAQIIIIGNALGYINVLKMNFQLAQTFVLLIIGLLLTFLGNRLPKSTKNYSFGVKIPSAYESNDLWVKTQRFVAKVWFCSGILIMLIAVIPWSGVTVIALCIIAAVILLPRIYIRQIINSNK